MKLLEAKHIYMIGIGGIAMSALARLFLHMGKSVSGSDLKLTEITQGLDKIGCKIYDGHVAKHLEDSVDYVIYTQAVSKESEGGVELAAAEDRKIPTMVYSQALGTLMEGHYGIGVTGTNGKSTTTALLGLMLEASGFDPTVVLGSQISPPLGLVPWTVTE